MTRRIAVLIIFAAGCAQASDVHFSGTAAEILCSDSWYRFIDDTVVSSDNQGHGPDIGSDEWKSVIEFKLGIRDEPNLPDRDSDAWCRHIDQIVREKDTASSPQKGDLVAGSGPFRFICDENPANEVIVSFFQTDPPTLIAERGDNVSLMYLQPSASGTKYQGRNEIFWEHQGEASITWGYGAQEMRCKKAP